MYCSNRCSVFEDTSGRNETLSKTGLRPALRPHHFQPVARANDDVVARGPCQTRHFEILRYIPISFPLFCDFCDLVSQTSSMRGTSGTLFLDVGVPKVWGRAEGSQWGMPQNVDVHRGKMRFKVWTMGWKRRFQNLRQPQRFLGRRLIGKLLGCWNASISLEMLEEDQTNGKTFPDALYHNDKMVSRNSLILNPISEDCGAWFPDSGRWLQNFKTLPTNVE